MLAMLPKIDVDSSERALSPNNHVLLPTYMVDLIQCSSCTVAQLVCCISESQ